MKTKFDALKLTRRDFLKASALGAGLLAVNPRLSLAQQMTEVPSGGPYGRVFYKVEIKEKPTMESETIAVLYDDAIVPWLREIVGGSNPLYVTNRKWVDTGSGYVPSSSVQQVWNLPNEPLEELPVYESKPGFWAEITVPYAELSLVNPPGRAPVFESWVRQRFYYSQVFWVDEIKKTEDGRTLYRITEPHGSYGDMFWSNGRGYRPILPEELAPINPDITDKLITIDVNHQTLSCRENGSEIFFSRISSGARFNAEGKVVEKWSTPIGDNHVVNRKFASLHMAGGSADSGFDLFGVAWASIFATGGVAIHSTYWHNNYGEPMSHGCVNMKPEDAKFVYRWSQPNCGYTEGKIEVQGYSGTRVRVIAG